MGGANGRSGTIAASCGRSEIDQSLSCKKLISRRRIHIFGVQRKRCQTSRCRGIRAFDQVRHWGIKAFDQVRHSLIWQEISNESGEGSGKLAKPIYCRELWAEPRSKIGDLYVCEKPNHFQKRTCSTSVLHAEYTNSVFFSAWDRKPVLLLFPNIRKVEEQKMSKFE